MIFSSRSARASYQFWRDPICLLSWGAYLLNRWWLGPHFGVLLPFLREHFNDSLLIPATLPVLYHARWRLGLCQSPVPPSWWVTLGWCAGWSLFFEWIGPRFLHHSVGDWGDVVAYFGGGSVAAAWWSYQRQRLRAREGGRIGASPLS